jgi:hypothetical protein
MSYKPDEKAWMSYLYGESDGEEKEEIEQYLLENADARIEFEKFQTLRRMMSSVEDKEVIAPPIFVGEEKQRFMWNAPYFKTVISIAASLLIIIVAGKLTGTQMSFSNNEFKLSFGELKKQSSVQEVQAPVSTLTAEQVQKMISASLSNNNIAMEASLRESQEKLDASIKKNLAANSGKIDVLVKQASNASQAQIRDYVASMQTENMQLVKNYFQLTSADQKKYVENLLVDFAQYLQQQRNDDLQIVQTKLNSMEQNTNMFKQETEQILSSIITTVGNGDTKETKN